MPVRKDAKVAIGWAPQSVGANYNSIIYVLYFVKINYLGHRLHGCCAILGRLHLLVDWFVGVDLRAESRFGCLQLLSRLQVHAVVWAVPSHVEVLETCAQCNTVALFVESIGTADRDTPIDPQLD